jgi:rod shape-determining protein MreC
VRGSRRLRLTLVFLLLSAFTLTALDRTTASSGPLAALRRGVDTVFGPVERLVGGAAGSVGRALGSLPKLGSYQSENRKLQRQVDTLNGRIAAMSGLQCQVDQFYALMHLVDASGYAAVPAKVIGVGPADGFEWTAVIDAGSADGIKAAQTVVTGAGLVGRTTQVSRNTAHVLLLADPDFAVGGTLAQVASIGVARGRGSRPLTYSLASSRALVRKGDVLLTTGSDTYAAGIPIGTVLSVAPDANAISRTATVAPFVDVSSLDVVGVITKPGRSKPRSQLRPVAPGASPTSSPCPAAVPQGPVPTAIPTPSPTPQPSVTVSPSPSASGVPSPTWSPGR